MKTNMLMSPFAPFVGINEQHLAAVTLQVNNPIGER
jgi:hypothetical protein